MSSFAKGVAMIYEGDTERVFYHSMLEYYTAKHTGYSLSKQFDESLMDYQFVLADATKSIVIKLFTAGTVIANKHNNVDIWFTNSCYERYKSLDWKILYPLPYTRGNTL